MQVETQLPPIVLTAEDYDRLVSMAEAATRTMPEVADYLMEELERAAVVDGPDLPPNVVTMGSTVTFRDEETQETRRVTLVFPGEADLAAGRLSVMTPVGAALIGLKEGQSIRWLTRSGRSKLLIALKVEPPRR